MDDTEVTSMTVSLMSSGGDNASMASVDSAYLHMPYSILDNSVDSLSIGQASIEKSDMEILLRGWFP